MDTFLWERLRCACVIFISMRPNANCWIVNADGPHVKIKIEKSLDLFKWFCWVFALINLFSLNVPLSLQFRLTWNSAGDKKKIKRNTWKSKFKTQQKMKEKKYRIQNTPNFSLTDPELNEMALSKWNVMKSHIHST